MTLAPFWRNENVHRGSKDLRIFKEQILYMSTFEIKSSGNDGKAVSISIKCRIFRRVKNFKIKIAELIGIRPE
jgi:hypothetical protein